MTVFRSADPTAEDDARAVIEMLAAEGITGSLLDDDSPGVPEGAWEVRVAPDKSAQAEALIETFRAAADEPAEVDESHDLDLVTVFRSAGNSGEMEAMSVKGLLEAEGLQAFLVGDSRLPNLPDEVRVPRADVTTAKRLIADAIAAGPTAADEAESEGER